MLEFTIMFLWGSLFFIIVNFTIQKMECKHTSPQKYIKWDKLSFLHLYIFYGTRGNIFHIFWAVVCLSFLWWEFFFWGNERKYFAHIPGPKYYSNGLRYDTYVLYLQTKWHQKSSYELKSKYVKTRLFLV